MFDQRKSANLFMTVLIVTVMVGSALAILSTPSMGEDKPDLYLETKDIHFSDNEPEEGDNITIYATIHNGGTADASNILVTFKDHSHGEGDTTVIGNTTVKSLGSGEQTNASISWTADPAGNHTIKVYIDIPNEIDESNEANNNAEQRIVVKKKSQGEDTVLHGHTKRKDNGQHISHVSVKVTKGDYSETTTSDGDGWYEFELSEGGNYSVHAEKDGYETLDESVHVPESKTTTHHIQMTEDDSNVTKIEGHVYEKESRGGTPIEHAEVTITGNSCNCSYTVYTDSEGYYGQELPQADNWTVTAEAEGYTSETKHQYVKEGETAEVNFHLEKESGEDTILNGYTKEKRNGSRIAYVSIRVSMGNFSETIQSDSNGYYEIELPEGGTYRVRTEKSGYKDLETNVTVDEGETKALNLFLDREGTEDTWIEGYVMEADGRGGETPIEDAEVTITLISCQCGTMAYTDETGYYQRKLDEGGDYTVEAEALGYHSQKVNKTIEEGEYNYQDFELERIKDKTVLKGFTRSSGSRSELSDVEVTVTKDNFSETTYSNKDGYYEFQLDEGGNYSVTASKKGYENYENTVYLEEEEETTLHIHLARDEEYTILHGHALENGREGEFMNDVTVTITKGNHTDSSVTGEDGYFEFELPGSGQYRLVGSKDGYQDYIADETVWKGEDKTHTISMNRTYVSIFGYVKDKDTDDPIHGATVTVTGNECNCSYSGTTDDRGYYEIDFHVEGNFTVRVEKAGYGSEQKDTDVTHHSSPSRVDFHLQRMLTKVHGYVIEGGSRESGAGINDAKVHIHSIHETYTVYTLQTGYYHHDLMKGGEFTITVSKEGYITQSKAVTIQDGQEKQVDFVLEPDTSAEEDRLYMSPDGMLKPDVPADGSSASAQNVEAVYDQSGHLVRTNRRWVEVGTWTSEPLMNDVTLEGVVTFNLWFKEKDEGYDNVPQWRFTFLTGSETLAYVETGHTDSDPDNVIEITATADLSITRGSNSVTIGKGGTLSLSIEYIGWEDIDIYYGNTDYDSGLAVKAVPGFTEKPAKENFGVAVTASKTTLDLEGKSVTVVTFTVKNIGEIADSYTLSITGTFKGWTATMDSPDTITLEPGEMQSVSLTLNASETEDPEGDEIVVEVTAISQTYPDIQDSVRIEGKLEGDSGIPDLTIPLIVASIGAGALVASFRRRY